MAENLWELLEHSLRKHSGHPAWIVRLGKGKKRVVNYDQIYTGALCMAKKLRQRGVEKGDIVGVYAPNGPEWSVAALAAWKLGAIVAPLHVGYSEKDMETQIAALDPTVILWHTVENDFKKAVKIELCADETSVEQESRIPCPAKRDDEAARIYTSGSTGNPKMVRLSHGNIISNVEMMKKTVLIHPSDTGLSLLPLSHAMELSVGMIYPLSRGVTLVLPRVVAASEILGAMEQENISFMIAVPRLYRNIMQGINKKIDNAGPLMRAYAGLIRKSPPWLKKIINKPLMKKFGGDITIWVSGGSRLDPEILAFFRALGFPLRQGYGLTETSPGVAFQQPDEEILDSIGKPLEGIEARINEPDEEGNGELWIKGPNVMMGYVDEAQTAEVMEDGWFKTGDIAKINPNGSITLTGRSKRLIVTEAGKNVVPEDLEVVLERIPRVKEAAITEKDMRPAAILAIEEGYDPEETAKAIIREFNSIVSGHKQVARYAIVDELPKTPLGKVSLKELPELFDKHEVK